MAGGRYEPYASRTLNMFFAQIPIPKPVEQFSYRSLVFVA